MATSHRLHDEPPTEDVTNGHAGSRGRSTEVRFRRNTADRRLLVPHLYFWKSGEGIARLTLLDHDEPGFWERNGYHDHGDPWTEQRYQGD
jgi:hypothetical protein